MSASGISALCRALSFASTMVTSGPAASTIRARWAGVISRTMRFGVYRIFMGGSSGPTFYNRGGPHMAIDSSGRRQMTLVAFLQAQNCSSYAASWRHAAAAPDFLTADYYQRIARVLEAGRFDLAFFDDRLALPDRYGDDHSEAVRHGIRVVKMDLVPLIDRKSV